MVDLSNRLDTIIRYSLSDKESIVVYARILLGIEINENEEQLIREKFLAVGLVFIWQDQFKVYPIYREVFHKKWIAKRLYPEFDFSIKEWLGENQELIDITKKLFSDSNFIEDYIDSLLGDDFPRILFEEKFINDWENNTEDQHKYIQNTAEKLKKNQFTLILYYKLISGCHHYLNIQNSFPEQEQKFIDVLAELKIIKTNENKEVLIPLFVEIFTSKWINEQLFSEYFNEEWIKEYELPSMLTNIILDYSEPLTEDIDWKDSLITEIVQHWKHGKKEIDKDLQNKEQLILKDKKNLQKVLDIYSAILREEHILFLEDKEAHTILITSGIVKKNEEEKLVSVNSLYQKIFDDDWVKRQKKVLRDYRYYYNILDWIKEKCKKAQLKIRKICVVVKSYLSWITMILVVVITIVGIVIYFFPNTTILFRDNDDAKAELALETFQTNQKQGLAEVLPIVKKLRNNEPRPYEKYKTVQPLYNLQTMIKDIYEYKEIAWDKNYGDPKIVKFAPQSESKILVGTNAGKLLLYDISQQPPLINDLFKEEKDHNEITSIAYSRNLIAIASSGNSGTLTLLNNNFKILYQKRGVQNTIRSIDFSINGKYILTGDDNGSAKLWEVTLSSLKQLDLKPKFGASLGEPNDLMDSIAAVKFNPDGKQFAIAGEDGKTEKNKTETVKIWNLNNLDNEPTKIPTSLIKIESISFNSNGEKMAIAGDNQLCLFNLMNINDKSKKDTDKNCKEVKGVKSVEFLPQPNEEQIVTGDTNGVISVWNFKQDNEALRLIAHKNMSDLGVFSLSFSSTGNDLVSSGKDQNVRIWKLSKFLNPENSRILKINKNINYFDVGLLDDNNYRLVAISSKNGEFWNINDEKKFFNTVIPNVKLMRLLKKSGTYDVIFIYEDNTVKIYNLSKEEDSIRGIKASYGEIVSVISSDNGKIFILINNKYDLLIFDKDCNYLGVKSIGKDIGKEKLQNIDISLSSDGKYLAYISNNQAHLWNISDPNKIEIIDWKNEQPTNANLTKINEQPNNANLIKINEQPNNANLIKINEQLNNANLIKINPNSHNLVIAYGNGVVRLWSLDGNLLDEQQKSGDPLQVRDLQFYPDGDYVAILDGDKTARIWQIKDNKKLNVLPNKEIENKEIDLEKDISKISVTHYDDNIGHLLATISPNQNNPIIKIFDIKGRQISQFKTNLKDVEHLQFTPDRPKYEKYIIASDTEGTIEAWEIKNVEKLIQDGDQWLEKK